MKYTTLYYTVFQLISDESEMDVWIPAMAFVASGGIGFFAVLFFCLVFALGCGSVCAVLSDMVERKIV